MTHLQSNPSTASTNAQPLAVANNRRNRTVTHVHRSLGASASKSPPERKIHNRLSNHAVKNHNGCADTLIDNRPSGADALGVADAAPRKVDILGVDFDNLSAAELLGSLRKGVVFTPNVDHLMKLRHDPEFAAVYQRADFKVCDSQIVMYAAKFLGRPLKAKLSGSDLFPWFCDYHRDNEDINIFLLGGRAGIAKEAQSRINARIGREIVVGEYSPPYGFEHSAVECEQVVQRIKQSSANVVAVCLGAPKQEKWIAANCDRLPNVDIFMAVGAVVDFEAGAKPRAPKYVSELGLEWLYRLICEPRRLWRRYLLEDMPFVGLVLAEKFKQLGTARRASVRRAATRRTSSRR